MEIEMDVSNIDIGYIESFDTYYTLACGIFGILSDSPTPQKSKKIRKWLKKNCISDQSLPKSILKHVSDDADDTVFFDFFKSCSDHIAKYGNAQKQRFDKAASDLSEDVKDALWSFMSVQPDISVDKRKGIITSTFENSSAYRRAITFTSASCPDMEYDFLSFENGSLTKQEDRYLLCGEAVSYDDETERIFIISFSDVIVDIELYNASKTAFVSDPWTHLELMANAIYEKQFLHCDCFNEKEKACLPLIIDLCRLTAFSIFKDEFKSQKFSALLTALQEYGDNKVAPLLDKLSSCHTDFKTRNRIRQRINNHLNTQKYEGLWRRIYAKICDSQSDYTVFEENAVDKNILNNTRAEIQRLMEDKGYNGSYPDFYKSGKSRGIRLAYSYCKSYFVGFEKNAKYHIHCDEDTYSHSLSISFLCGTALLKKNETSADAYSCTFDACGRRFYKTVSYTVPFDNEDDEIGSDNDTLYDLESAVNIATKKAELKKLSRAEKRSMNVPRASFSEFLIAFMVFGGLFAIMMTAAMMLIAVLITALFGLASAIPEMLSEVPWILIFIISWVGFGGSMSIIELLSKRK